MVRVCRNLKLNADVDGQFRRRRPAHLPGEDLRARRPFPRQGLVALGGLAARRTGSGATARSRGAWRWSWRSTSCCSAALLHWVDPLPGKNWWEHVYFSAITYLTVGYGDLAPHSPLAQLLSVVCAAAGIATFGMLIASVTKKVMYR